MQFVHHVLAGAPTPPKRLLTNLLQTMVYIYIYMYTYLQTQHTSQLTGTILH